MPFGLGRGKALFWDLQSLIWDDYLEVPECRQAIQGVAAWFAALADSGGRVLDIGCGTGNYALALAELGYEVVGVDLSAGMLRRARAKARQLPTGNVSFHSADFDRGLPFPAHSFDGALCVAALQCARDASLLLAEARRVLRPEGCFLLLTLDSTQRSSAKRHLKPGLARLALRWLKALSSRTRSVRRYDHDQLIALLGQAGFELIAERRGDGSLGLMCRAATGHQSALGQGRNGMAHEDRALRSLEASVEAMLAEHERVAALYRDNADMGERRTSMYLTVVSAGSAVLLAMAQLGLGPMALLWPSIALMSGMLLLGLLTFQRLVERRVHATEYLRAVNRIHCYFAQKDPELGRYYYWPPCDDSPSFTTGQSQMAGLRDIIALLNSLFAGLLLGILVYEARPAMQYTLGLSAGAAVALGSWCLQQRYECRTLQAAESHAEARVHFPRCPEHDTGV